MKHEWDGVEDIMRGTKVNTVKVDISKPSSKKIVKDFNIVGVPEIVKVDKFGTKTRYHGDRKTEKIVEWINKEEHTL